MRLVAAGIESVVAPLGTALTEAQALAVRYLPEEPLRNACATPAGGSERRDVRPVPGGSLPSPARAGGRPPIIDRPDGFDAIESDADNLLSLKP